MSLPTDKPPVPGRQEALEAMNFLYERLIQDTATDLHVRNHHASNECKNYNLWVYKAGLWWVMTDERYPISPPPPDMINEKLQVFREQTELPEYWTIFLRVVQGWDYHGDCRRYYREHKMVAMIRDTAHQSV
ncbi:Protein of unknown function [Pyronema omphalodes CBS 100304]|uniref:Uncharacterized protein n=1 Tax=Pyronema omphalodes (strain CBS 100304) TaxID=1076935 RepID=U4LVN0_PYROM|nr:Protein of unknown function [Pyronema omphalodes CBS 100304]